MRKPINKHNLLMIGFLAIEFILWLLIIKIINLTIKDPELSGQFVIVAQFTFVVFNVACTFLFNRKINLIHIGLIATLFGDFFLTLLRPQLLEAGLAFFLIAHLIYSVFLLKQQSKQAQRVHIILRSALSVAVIVVAFILFGKSINLLILLAAVYVVNFAINIVYAFMKFKTNYLFAIGLVLFFLCDIIIGLRACESIGLFTIELNGFIDQFCSWRFLNPPFGENVAWIYYCPSQTLIALFAISQNKKLFTKSN